MNKLVISALAVLPMFHIGVMGAMAATQTTFGDVKSSATGIYTNDAGEIGVSAVYSAAGTESIAFDGVEPVMSYPYQTIDVETNLLVTGFYQEAYATNGIDLNGTYSLTDPDQYVKDDDTNATVVVSGGAGYLKYSATTLFEGTAALTDWNAVEDFGAFTNGTTVLDYVTTTNTLTGTYDIPVAVSVTEETIANDTHYITIKVGDTLYDIPARVSGN